METLCFIYHFCNSILKNEDLVHHRFCLLTLTKKYSQNCFIKEVLELSKLSCIITLENKKVKKNYLENLFMYTN